MNVPAASLILGWVSVAHFAKIVLAASLQGRERIRARQFAYAEDAAAWNGTEADAAPSDLHRRAGALLRNDSENLPIFALLAASFVLQQGSALGAVVWFGGFTIARWLHAIAMLRRIQPLRTRAYAMGLVSLLGLALHILLLPLLQS